MVNAACFCAWPDGAFGLSSGWHQGPVSRRPLSVRQAVWLKPIDADHTATAPDHPSAGVPMMIKTPERDAHDIVRGLSSGAASALVRHDGRILKIKRCGFRDGATQRGEIGVYALRMTLIEIRECTGIEHRTLGWMGSKGAEREAAGLAAFSAAGLPVAYTPISTYAWTDTADPEDRKGALICEITSDLRGDEVFFAILTPKFAQLAEAGQLSFRPRDGRIDFQNAALDGAFVDIEIGQTGHRLEGLGKALGGALRRLHDAGLLRGHLNAWFGNDVVAPDGWICPVDCDGAVEIARYLAPDKVKRMQQLERVEYSTLLFAELIHFQSVLIAEAGRRLRDAFDQGYDTGAEPRLDPNLFHMVLVDFVAARPKLDRDATILKERHGTRRYSRVRALFS